MSLAQSISEQLNGRKAGSGYSIPAICHSPDSTKFNLQISDGNNGKLSAYCHSNACDYRTIMQAFEDRGLKPRDVLAPAQKLQLKTERRNQATLKILWHELHVLLWYFDKRMTDPALQKDEAFLKKNPSYSPLPEQFEPREQEAIIRINLITGQLK